jgi:hypothetical protein
MSDDNAFYSICWKLVTLALVLLIITVGSCTMFESYLIATAPVDPLRLRCALNAGGSNIAVCTIIAVKEK